MSQVYTPKGHEIGKICKQWSGAAQEIFTEADNFGITCKSNIDY